MNIFTAEGTVCSISDERTTQNGKRLVTVTIDVTDEFDGSRNLVPFTICLNRYSLPDGLSVGDVVSVQFRLGTFRYGTGGSKTAANLRIGKITVVHRASDYMDPHCYSDWNENRTDR